jgi:SAM-dependent methyltransferase
MARLGVAAAIAAIGVALARTGARVGRPGASLRLDARGRLDAIRGSLRTSSSPGANAYAMLSGRILGGYYRAIAADCARALDGVTDPRILEVGPGPGDLAVRLLETIPAGWTGLDIDPAMLAVAGRRLADEGLRARATLVEGDVASLPFADGSFDLVVSSLAAHHWPDAETGFLEIRRVLRPGRKALVYDLPAGWGHFETGSRGIDAAGTVFDEPITSRFRGIGPLTMVARVEATRAVVAARRADVRQADVRHADVRPTGEHGPPTPPSEAAP